MGLFDSISSNSGGLLGNMDDPQSQGLLGAAMGLLSASGPSRMPIGMGQAMAQGLQGYQQGRKGAMDEATRQEQLKMLKLQEQRAQGLYDNQMSLLNKLNGGSSSQTAADAPMPGQLGGGMAGIISPPNGMPLVSPSKPQSSGGGLANMSLDDLGGAAVAGVPGTKELFDIKKYQMDGVERKPGSAYDVNGARQWISDPKTGFNGYDANGNIIQSGNFNQITGDTAAAQSGGTERGKAPFSFQTVTPPAKPNPVTGKLETTPTLMSVAQIAKMVGGGDTPAPDAAPPTSAPAQPTMPVGLQARADYLKSITDPTERQSFINTVYKNIAFAPAAQRDQLGKMWSDVVNGTGQAQSVPATQPASQPTQASSGGIALQSPAEAKAIADTQDVEKQGKLKDMENFQVYKDGLNKAIDEQRGLVQRNQEILPLLNQFQTGLMGADGRLKLASTIQNAFAGDDRARAIAQKIAGGDVSAGQELNQMLSSAGLSNLIQVLQGQGRVNNAEFKALQSHAESNMSDPDTLRRVMNYQNKLYNQSFNEQQAIADAEKNGTLNPKTWRGDYSKILNDTSLGAQTAPLSPPVQQVINRATNKSATLADIAATAKASGKTTAEVTAALRAKGYAIGGQ